MTPRLNIAVFTNRARLNDILRFGSENRQNLRQLTIVLGRWPCNARVTNKTDETVCTMVPAVWFFRYAHRYDALEFTDPSVTSLFLALNCRRLKKPLIYRPKKEIGWVGKLVLDGIKLVSGESMIQPETPTYYPEIRQALETWLAGEAIESLYTPLRYDVLVRAEFLQWYEDHRELYSRDREQFLKLARRTDFHHQFAHVSQKSKRSNWSEQEEQEAFRIRVDTFIAMYENIKRYGFDTEKKIQLHSADRIEKTESGKFIKRRWYIGNGCHRLAILIKLQSVMRSEYFYVKQHAVHEPRDNTCVHIADGRLGIDQYASFMRPLYLRDGKVRNPQELKDVVDRDARLFSMAPQTLARHIIGHQNTDP